MNMGSTDGAEVMAMGSCQSSMVWIWHSLMRVSVDCQHLTVAETDHLDSYLHPGISHLRGCLQPHALALSVASLPSDSCEDWAMNTTATPRVHARGGHCSGIARGSRPYQKMTKFASPRLPCRLARELVCRRWLDLTLARADFNIKLVDSSLADKR